MAGNGIKMVRISPDDFLIQIIVPVSIGHAVGTAPLPAVHTFGDAIFPEGLYIGLVFFIAVAVYKAAILFHGHIGLDGIRNFHDPGIPFPPLLMADAMEQGRPDDIGYDIGYDIELETALCHHMVPAG